MILRGGLSLPVLHRDSVGAAPGIKNVLIAVSVLGVDQIEVRDNPRRPYMKASTHETRRGRVMN